MKNLEITVRLVCPNVTIEELPNKSHVNRKRGVIRVITETLAVHELGKNPE